MIPTIDTRGTYCKSIYAPSRIRIKIECQNNDEISANIEGCEIQMQKELGNFWGGHFQPPHYIPERPLGSFIPEAIENRFYEIPLTGLSFDYESPQPAGEIDLNFIASGPDNKIFEVPKSIAQVKINDLVSLAGVPYLTMLDTGHLTHDESEEGGVFATSKFKKQLHEALDLYYKRCLKENIPEAQIVRLTSEAASLVWGGLYDIDFDWEISHCGHRVGNAIDIGMLNFRLSTSPHKEKMKTILKESLKKNGMGFPVPAESPTSLRHWHTQLK